MSTLSKQYLSMVIAHRKYDKELGALEGLLSEKINFLYGIENLPGDGFCLLHQATARLAPLDKCLNLIEVKGFMTEEDLFKLSI